MHFFLGALRVKRGNNIKINSTLGAHPFISFFLYGKPLNCIKVYTVCKGYKRSSDKVIHFFNMTPLDNVQWTNPNALVSNQREESFSIQGSRVAPIRMRT